MVTRGTFRESDGSAVEIEDAKAAWIPLARDALMQVAGVYHGLITSGELAATLQSESGIHTKQLVHYWIGDVLGSVARDCYAKDEPLLSSLCVQHNGTTGAGFAEALADTYGGPTPEDLDMAAAEERFKCYQFFGAKMPADGGRVALTRQVATKRRTAQKRAQEDRVRPVCPTCHLTVPANGRCDTCE
jgi:hypothetical protein